MKLRIHKNSIRLRLSQTEVDKVAKGQAILETLETGGGDRESNFSYSLIPSDGNEQISAEFKQNNLKIVFPKNQAEEWANTDKVAVSQLSDKGVTILIEKDFQCLHKRPNEDETDNFRNPLAGQVG